MQAKVSDHSKLQGVMSEYHTNIGIHDNILLIKQMNLLLEIQKLLPEMEVKGPGRL